MYPALPEQFILMTVAAFLIGWLISSLSSSIGAKQRVQRRDPRDDRIRSLEAEYRIAQTGLEKEREKTAELESELEESRDGNEKRDNVISHQQEKLDQVSKDLKESVLKTRELRSDLSNRATENIKSEVKLREVETELSVAQASTDMIATGVLDYSFIPDEDGENESDEHELLRAASSSKT
jgi:Skp family chaperone for outer membrane proteins